MSNVKGFLSIALVGSLLFNIIFAEGIAAQEKPKKDMTVAIVDFTNTRNVPDLDYLVKGIPESIVTYLGKKGRVRIVERARLQSALEEMRLAQAGIVDEQMAVQVGKAVGADAVIVGSFLQIGDVIRINARLINVETSEIIVAEQVSGKPGTDLFALMDRTAASMETKLLGEGILNVQQITAPQQTIKGSRKTWWLLGILGVGVVGGAALALKPKAEKAKNGTILINISLP